MDRVFYFVATEICLVIVQTYILWRKTIEESEILVKFGSLIRL